MQNHYPIKPIKAYVFKNFLIDDLQDKGAFFIECEIIGLCLYEGEAIAFDIVLNDGSIFNYIPPHKIKHDISTHSSIGLSKLEVLSYLGLSYNEAIEGIGEDKAYEDYKKIGRQSFLPINTIKKILDYENIDLLITTNSPRFEKASLFASKELNIKSIQIIDLFGDDLME